MEGSKGIATETKQSEKRQHLLGDEEQGTERPGAGVEERGRWCAQGRRGKEVSVGRKSVGEEKPEG